MTDSDTTSSIHRTGINRTIEAVWRIKSTRLIAGYLQHPHPETPLFLIGILLHLLVLAGSVHIIRELVAYRISA